MQPGGSYLIDAGVRNVVILQDKPDNVTIHPRNTHQVCSLFPFPSPRSGR